MIRGVLAAGVDFAEQISADADSGVKVNDHHSCAFGVWYDSVREEYADIPAFVQIDEPHARVHRFAQEVINNATIERVEELVQASTEILRNFIRLVEKVA